MPSVIESSGATITIDKSEIRKRLIKNLPRIITLVVFLLERVLGRYTGGDKKELATEILSMILDRFGVKSNILGAEGLDLMIEGAVERNNGELLSLSGAGFKLAEARQYPDVGVV